MTKPWLFSTGTALQMLCLALIAGGIVALGAFVAPVMFKAFPRAEVGAALTVVFRRFDMLLLGASVGIVLGEVLRVLSGLVPVRTVLAGIRYVIMAALIGAALFSALKVDPEIEQMQHAGVHPGATKEGLAFLRTHQLSENLYKGQMLGAILLILMTPFVYRASAKGA